MIYDQRKQNSPNNEPKGSKKFFTSPLKSVFPSGSPQRRYSSGDIVKVIKNAISPNEYIGTRVRNRTYVRGHFRDTVFRGIRDIGSESGSYMRKGSEPRKKGSSHWTHRSHHEDCSCNCYGSFCVQTT